MFALPGNPSISRISCPSRPSTASAKLGDARLVQIHQATLPVSGWRQHGCRPRRSVRGSPRVLKVRPGRDAVLERTASSWRSSERHFLEEIEEHLQSEPTVPSAVEAVGCGADGWSTRRSALPRREPSVSGLAPVFTMVRHPGCRAETTAAWCIGAVRRPARATGPAAGEAGLDGAAGLVHPQPPGPGGVRRLSRRSWSAMAPQIRRTSRKDNAFPMATASQPV